jgi:hypothetical protein
MKIGFLLLLATITPVLLWAQSAYRPDIPKTWDEASLADWATPVAGLNVRPTLISAKEYYSFTVENLRTYPVYFPGREPEGYWEMLQHVGPKPLIEPEKLKTEADWIEAGRRVFEEVDDLELRTFNPKLVAAARSLATFEAAKASPLRDGSAVSMRWVPTKKVSPSHFRIAPPATCFTGKMERLSQVLPH